jgi:fibronectin-binding autotransporter adhesin
MTERQRRRRTKRLRHRSAAPKIAAGATVGAAALAIAAPASAKTYTVTSLANGGAGSLRNAVSRANAHTGADTITFQPGFTGTIKLRTGELEVDDPLTIEGPGAPELTVSGTNRSRIFNFEDAATVSGLTLTKGSADYGGAIEVGVGPVTVQESVVTGNAATQGGGGINVDSLSDVTVDASTVSDNQASRGGGIRISGNGVSSLKVTDSTIADNMAASTGGGIENFGGTVNLSSSTLAGNVGAGLTDDQQKNPYCIEYSIYPPYACIKFGYTYYNPQTHLDDSIVANNYTVGPFSSEYDIYSANYDVDTTHSVIMNTTGAQINDNGGNFLNQDPGLGSLRMNGGPTPTRSINRTSVAVGGADSNAPASDQRGYGRFNAPDIGAFEYKGVVP